MRTQDGGVPTVPACPPHHPLVLELTFLPRSPRRLELVEKQALRSLALSIVPLDFHPSGFFSSLRWLDMCFLDQVTAPCSPVCFRCCFWSYPRFHPNANKCHLPSISLSQIYRYLNGHNPTTGEVPDVKHTIITRSLSCTQINEHKEAGITHD